VAGPERVDGARERKRLSHIWAQGDYERVAATFASIHDEFVAGLAPRADERWLDVGTGTGEVALRAARAGAHVIGLDITPALLEQARVKADAAGLPIELVEGDVQSLPFADESFDVVVSVFGMVFAPDRTAVAGELTRVTRRGGRLSFTAWRPASGPDAVYARFRPPEAAAPRDHREWGDEQLVRNLFGDAFALEFREGISCLDAESAEVLVEFATEAVPPTAAFLATLDDARRDKFRQALAEYYAQRADADGSIHESHTYLVVTGVRR
jgi:ubiquinone/menaquinone biosynthesis C-methylase UbiE